MAARLSPMGLRVPIHRLRGVAIGERVRIATDVILETAYPEWISIGNDVQIGVRTIVLADIHALRPQFSTAEEQQNYISVRIEDDVNIGPGCIVLPHVTIGRGSVVTAGSVVTRAVPPMTMVRGNPAEPVARLGIPLSGDTKMKEFMRALKPV
jgi:acetyltransferase-like isoleucine patch superfamily enzyme